MDKKKEAQEVINLYLPKIKEAVDAYYNGEIPFPANYFDLAIKIILKHCSEDKQIES